MALLHQNSIINNPGTWHPYTGVDTYAELIGSKSCSLNAASITGNLVIRSSDATITTISFTPAIITRTPADILILITAAGKFPASILDGGNRIHLRTTSIGKDAWIQIDPTTSVSVKTSLGFIDNQYANGLSYYQDDSDQPCAIVDGLEAYASLEPIYYRNINRVLLNLVDNDKILNNEIDKIWNGYDRNLGAAGESFTRQFIATEGYNIAFRFYNDGFNHIPGATFNNYNSTTGIVTFNAGGWSGIVAIGDYIYDGAAPANKFKIYAVTLNTVLIRKGVTFSVLGGALKGYIGKGIGELEIYNDVKVFDVEINGYILIKNLSILNVASKFFYLNINETGAGVSHPHLSGTVIERGSTTDAILEFNDDSVINKFFWQSLTLPFYTATGFYSKFDSTSGYYFGADTTSTNYIYYNSAKNYFYLSSIDGAVGGSLGYAGNLCAYGNYNFTDPLSTTNITYASSHFQFVDVTIISSIVEAGTFESIDSKFVFGLYADNKYLKYASTGFPASLKFNFYENAIIYNSIVGIGNYKEYIAGGNNEEIHSKGYITIGGGSTWTSIGQFNCGTPAETVINSVISSAPDNSTIFIKRGQYFIHSQIIVLNKNNIRIIMEDGAFFNVNGGWLGGSQILTVINSNNITIEGINYYIDVVSFGVPAWPLVDLVIINNSPGFELNDSTFRFNNSLNANVNTIGNFLRLESSANSLISGINLSFTKSFAAGFQNCAIREVVLGPIRAHGFIDILLSSNVIIENCHLDFTNACCSGYFDLLAYTFTMGILTFISSDNCIVRNNFIQNGYPVLTTYNYPNCANLIYSKQCYNFIIEKNKLLQNNAAIGGSTSVIRLDGYDALIRNNLIYCGEGAISPVYNFNGGSVYGIYSKNIKTFQVYNNQIVLAKSGNGCTNTGLGTGDGSDGGWVYGIHYDWDNTYGTSIYDIDIKNNIIGFQNTTSAQLTGFGGDAFAAGDNNGNGGWAFGINIQSSVVPTSFKTLIIDKNIINLYHGYAGKAGTNGLVATGIGGYLSGIRANCKASIITIDSNIVNIGQGGYKDTITASLRGGIHPIHLTVTSNVISKICNNNITLYGEITEVGLLAQKLNSINSATYPGGTIYYYAAGQPIQSIIFGNSSGIVWPASTALSSYANDITGVVINCASGNYTNTATVSNNIITTYRTTAAPPGIEVVGFLLPDNPSLFCFYSNNIVISNGAFQEYYYPGGILLGNWERTVDNWYNNVL